MSVEVGFTYRDILSPVHSVVNKKNLYKVKFRPTTLGHGYDDLNNIPNPVTYEICSLLSVISVSYIGEDKVSKRYVQNMVLCDHDNSDCSNCPFVTEQAMVGLTRQLVNRESRIM